ncbi:MAG: hypothetical protein J5849_03385, partial [Clostridia bacterium]|nr:hypothetical protein [Clostridia bacterium]
KMALLEALESERAVEIRAANGALTDHLLTRMRKDNEGYWLFVANGRKPQNPDIPAAHDVTIRLRGAFHVTLYDTLTGEIRPCPARVENGITTVYETLYDHDSRLYFLEEGGLNAPAEKKTESAGKVLPVPALTDYRLDEDNVFVLDMAEYALDGEEFHPAEELLRADNKMRRVLGWPSRMDAVAQPWVIPEEPFEHTAHLRFTFESDREIAGVRLAIEDGDTSSIALNGEKVANDVVGYYTDRSILTLALPPIRRGTNVLTVDIPFNRRTNIENAFLLGDFGVECRGKVTKITFRPEKIAFGDLAEQGFPFYGSSVTYLFDLETNGGELFFHAPQYRAGLLSVEIDGEDKGNIVYAPYTLRVKDVPAGKHRIGLKAWGNRVNSFGPLHLCDPKRDWIGPDAFRSEGDAWSYQYNLKKFGVLTDPTVEEK